MENPKLEQIKQQLASVPTLPGVYLWKDKDGNVIYVGKAKQLRARMRQYVNFQDSREKIPLLVSQIDSFEYIVVENEHESLVLEKNLINQYSPYFNADFKDDKSYPFIALTTGDVFPAIKYTRETHKANTRYFGPYTDSRAARELVDITRRIVPICASSCADWRRLKRRLESCPYDELELSDRPCFDAHVGLGPGACCGDINPEDYQELVKRVSRFLSGQHKEFLDELESNMEHAIAELDFEQAARIKGRIDTINSLESKQHVVSSLNLNSDVIGIYREETIAGISLLNVRGGKVINTNEFIFNKGKDVPFEDLSRMFILRYYDQTESIPHEIILDEMPEDAQVMEEWLTEKLNSPHGAKVSFVVPQRGERAALLQMANTNARHVLMRYKARSNYDDDRINAALLQLESALALDKPPMRIECFDISTIHGKHSVASMVVFVNGKPDKSQYRRFKIRMETEEANDFAMMSEVFDRRYNPEKMKDARFAQKPDLIIVDGGKPQLTAALKQLKELGADDIPVAGLAKRDEELFVPWQESGPVVLPGGSPSLYLVKQVRDEAHRFAITFHRELRRKAMTTSIIDEVPGIGPKRKKQILKHFGSFGALKAASLEEIKAARIVPDPVAEDLYAVLRHYEADESAPKEKTKTKAKTEAKTEVETEARTEAISPANASVEEG
ncbi:excinuclease ABC subunit UvrC [Anaerotardibacter muris]|uniref:excinuclease ABC subunit UvrC n=1 Tax=Anaerotardibacter muris TaxID=2941505 RepID=UPI00203AB4F9|nr:excinuclease ABC subunit UvrC [Anaerotardibacter muris]